MTNKKSDRNRTLSIKNEEIQLLKNKILSVELFDNQPNSVILGDFTNIKNFKKESVDLLILDPPYNLDKKFGNTTFSKMSVSDYTEYLKNQIKILIPLLKKTATIYICGDWLSSASIFSAASEFFNVRNRITWEREKGRGAKTNFKNSSEDIWFCTMSNTFTFNVDSIKLRRKVIAPYKDVDGVAKDWKESTDGRFRDTYPSNIWTDITIPFWSMPENTSHPTQKSEKLIAKLILASSNEKDLILDPFLGSGTTAVVAKKLNRNYIGIEKEEQYALFAAKRLELADNDKTIQGYVNNVFWERNTLNSKLSKQEIIITDDGEE